MATASTTVKTKPRAVGGTRQRGYVWRQIRRSWQLHVFIAAGGVAARLQGITRMYGVQIAFRDFLPGRSIRQRVGGHGELCPLFQLAHV
ncbi:MAG: hypothetical protein R2856_33105 [Caldilineaceae bacterium]